MHSAKHTYFNLYLPVLVIILLQSCSLTEDPGDSLLRKARYLQTEGHFKQAEEVYDKLSMLSFKEKDPLQLSILLNQARFYLKTKKFNKTIATCDKATQICQAIYGANDSLNRSILFILASAYAGLGEYDKALLNYKSIQKSASKSLCSKDVVELLPLIKSGDLEFKRNNLPAAFQYYLKALSIGAPDSTEMIARLINYRLALCSMALGNKCSAEIFFRNSLPHAFDHAAPRDIIDKYAQFVKQCGKQGSIAPALEESKLWQAKHKEYVDWQYARCNPSSRCVLMDKYTEQDYYLIDGIKDSLAKDNLLP